MDLSIAILSYRDVVPSSVAGPADILGTLRRVYPMLSDKQLKMELKIDLVTDSKGSFWKEDFETGIKEKLGMNESYDLIIIPAMVSNKIESVVARESRFISWIQQQYKKKAQLASICVGAFILAETGLLKGKKATTHWRFADLFRKLHPDVLMLDDKIIVEQGRIFMCGGAFSFTTFMIYLIEKFCGHEAATVASKVLMINIHQQPQNTFSIFQFQHEHNDEVVLKAQLYIEKNYAKRITVEEIASECNLSSRTLIRRFEQATSNTPIEYVQRVRIEAAKKMLESNNEGVELVAMKCGYEDMGFFRKVFKRHVDVTPREYQDKYGKTGMKKIVESRTISSLMK